MSVIYTKKYIMIEESEGFIRIRDRERGKNIIKIDTGNKVWNRVIAKKLMELLNNGELDPKEYEGVSCSNGISFPIPNFEGFDDLVEFFCENPCGIVRGIDPHFRR